MTRLTNLPGNISAALDMLAYSEIGPAMLAQSDDGYNVLVGSRPGHLIVCASYAKHPRVLNKALNSTAAGRYQFNWPTWCDAVAALGLTDFSPESQDRACAWLLQKCGAWAELQAGDFDAALLAMSKRWASVPGSTAGQPINSASSLLAVFTKAGGVAQCVRPE